jgi:hypothetical protein
MPRKLPRCERCGRAFRPDRYNEFHQKHCTHTECVLERKRARQREWHARRRATDAAFRERQNARCREANRRRRAALRPQGGGDDAEAAPVVLADVVAGLLSQLTDTTDPHQLSASLREYAARGQRVALPAPMGGHPP